MPDMIALCHALESTYVGSTIAQSAWLFPAIESIHMFGIVTVVGSTSVLDLRLMGISFKKDSVSSVVGGTLRWALYGFAVMLVTGALMFVSEASRCYTNTGFRWKMLLLAIAGVNALVFHFTAYRGVNRWERGNTPFAAKFAGAFSILLWFGIVAMGRWIAFF
ncbi:MAG: hypothetical protein LAO08_02930 [Acidobacteriia bacterium]|nr:hypothetical protein [Terriglobia bacterium]